MNNHQLPEENVGSDSPSEKFPMAPSGHTCSSSALPSLLLQQQKEVVTKRKYTKEGAAASPAHPHLRSPKYGYASMSYNPSLAGFHSPVSSREEWPTAPSSSGQTVVNIDELSASTKKKLDGLPPSSRNCIIYKIPDAMRKSNDKHFTPRIVSIGPLHYNGDRRTDVKERYLAEFLQYTKVSLGEFYKLILDNEGRLRNCYADVVDFDSEIFLKMVLVDAAFLIMILVYYSCKTLVSSTDRLFRKPQMINDIVYDVVLLENQLPFFILEDLYKLSKLQNIVESKSHLTFNEDTAMTVFAHEFLKDFMSPKVPERHPSSKPEHILDLYKSCLIPADWNPEKHETERTNVPSLKELYQAGVKIQVGCKENMFDIRFNDGILEIPPLHIHDFTELVLRNLLAYEICDCTKTRIFSDYFEMMRLLTLSSEDTELLVKNGVIINGLPNAEGVSTLFQNISTGNIIDWSQFLYSDVIKDLNEYYNLGWHKWKATLKEKYFKAPWAICSVSVAFLLLVLTIVQSVFAILQVVVPK